VVAKCGRDAEHVRCADWVFFVDFHRKILHTLREQRIDNILINRAHILQITWTCIGSQASRVKRQVKGIAHYLHGFNIASGSWRACCSGGCSWSNIWRACFFCPYFAWNNWGSVELVELIWVNNCSWPKNYRSPYANLHIIAIQVFCIHIPPISICSWARHP